MNGEPTNLVNGIKIEFHKEQFNRSRNGDNDPSYDLMAEALNALLGSLRFVTKGPQIRPPFALEQLQWRLQYLNDDGTELQEDPQLRRGIVGFTGRISVVGVTPFIWNQVHSLPEHFELPAWDTLRLDAVASLPHVGTALVLAWSSLEVFISVVLDRLATASSIPIEMWSWINRKNRKPSTDDHFDTLLRVFTNHSLKEDAQLWDAYKQLKDARNSYIHEGVATIGKHKDFVSLAKATQLVQATEKIINLIREWLPEDQRWPQVEEKITFQFPIILPGSKPSPELSPE
jgi:hypothetical protein